MLALVNVTSIVEGAHYDPACILQAGDHEFIDRPSWVYYRRGRIETLASIRLGVSRGEYVPKAPVSPKVFEQICDGIEVSNFITPHFQAYVRVQFALI
jgi:hypothetical protein